MNPSRQYGPSVEELKALNEKRREQGLPEIRPSMFEQVGLTTDENEMPPVGANPWHDPRYMTPAFLSQKGELLCAPIPRVHVRQMVNPELFMTGFLQGLSGKPLMTVCKFCEEIGKLEMAKDDSDDSYRAVQADHSHLLARTRETVKAVRERLIQVKAEYNGLRESLLRRGLGEAFDRAIAALERLESAAKTFTVGDSERTMKAILDVNWPFERPSVAYALRRIFENHSAPPMKVSDILRRIASFENRFLRANVSDDGTSVAREISRFKQDAERVRIMDALLENFLTAEWYVWPPVTNPDLKPPAKPPEDGTGPEASPQPGQ